MTKIGLYFKTSGLTSKLALSGCISFIHCYNHSESQKRKLLCYLTLLFLSPWLLPLPPQILLICKISSQYASLWFWRIYLLEWNLLLFCLGSDGPPFWNSERFIPLLCFIRMLLLTLLRGSWHKLMASMTHFTSGPICSISKHLPCVFFGVVV